MIAPRKIEREKEKVVSNCGKCNGRGCPACFGYCSFIDQMAASEIPVDYWLREMDNFYGEENFKGAIIKYIDNLEEMYDKGLTHCFAGERGRGKTMAACCILKRALLRNYSCMYTTMVDAVTKLMAPGSYSFRSKVRSTDFVVIDELDQRFFPSQGSMELYGNHFENMLRSRAQNKMPTIMCTNSPDTGQIFGGEFKKSFDSLGAQFVCVLPAGGKDARKGKERL